MRWNTRIAILAAMGCVIASILYFRVFQPGPSHSTIPIDSQEPPPPPFEMVLANQSDSAQEKPQEQPKPTEPSKPTPPPIAPAPAPKPQQEQAKPIPPTKPVEPPITIEPIVVEPPPKPQPRIYTVKSGDSLWTIARDQLGDASRHLELAKLNEAALGGDPDSLKVGQKIILPPK